MKKQLLLFVLILLPLVANAYDVKIDGIYYNLVNKGNIAIVTYQMIDENGTFGGYNSDYNGKIVIPSKIEYNGVEYSVTGIGDGAFGNCNNITDIVVPNSVTSIGVESFQQCGMKSVTLPNSIKKLGDRSFAYSKLLTIDIPNSVTEIGVQSFEYCSNLISINIPNSVLNIGDEAFMMCTSLSSVSIANTIASIGHQTFRGCKNLTTIIVPNSVTNIGRSAFMDCIGLTSITIPNNVTSIGWSAFQGCSSLLSVTIPNSVLQIGENAFYKCSNLHTITIGSGVNTIKNKVFSNCENLADVYCLAKSVPSTFVNAFNESYIEYVTLHVPAESVNAYKVAEPWKNFKSIVALESDTPNPKCATPTISYNDGELIFGCDTEGVDYVTDITSIDVKKHYDAKITLTTTYKVSVYATKAGYDNSDTATLDINIRGKKGDINGDGEINVADHVKLSEIIMGNP